MGRLFLLVLICAPVPAWACSCGRAPSAKEAWLRSPLVFVGIVEKTDPTLLGGRTTSSEQAAWVRVTEPFKGVVTGQILELRDQFSSCFDGFEDGANELFYLYPSRTEGVWVAPSCHRSRSISRAADDLKFLRGLPASARGNRVSGTVGVWEDDPVKGSKLIRMLDGVRVRAVAGSVSFETTTDADGLYEFRDLPPNTYTIRIDYPKGTKLDIPIPYGKIGPRRAADSYESLEDIMYLEVTETSGNGFDFVLSPDTRITGQVLGPDGGLMHGVCLYLEPLHVASDARLGISKCTESDGSYALEKIPAGSYRIVANRGGHMTAAAPFGQLYYPGTPDIEKAGILTIAAGQYLDGIDFRVPELARRIELRGRLKFRDGVPLPDQSVEFQGNDGRYRQNGRTDGDGNFVMQVLAGRPGTLTSEILVWRHQAGACPQFKVEFHPNGYAASLESLPAPVGGDDDRVGIEVVFPSPSCDAWLESEAEMRKKIDGDRAARTPAASPQR